MKLSSLSLKALLIATPLVLVACGGDDDDFPTFTPTPTPEPTPTPQAEFTVTVVNTTHNQPLSPIAVVLHDGEYSPWAIGSAATAGLEQLAESGSPADFIAEASEEVDAASGDGVVGPGGSSVIEVSGDVSSELYITVATMLVNTNDAFAGRSGINVGDLALGEYVKMYAPIYDAGTEANDELSANIPGPAAGGEGYNAERETRDQVTRHPGVVTQADGYAESALDESHRFDNGAMLITIERTL